ncbi:hypothetical protein CFP59_09020 [Streptomyces malaysiensis subsp. malaysiensis]|nr:hypothetical protein CFP59_09020 [Streptomyces sp. M56]
MSLPLTIHHLLRCMALAVHRTVVELLMLGDVASVPEEERRHGVEDARCPRNRCRPGDGGSDWGLKAAVEQGLIEGPRVLVANRPLSQTGGHGDFRRMAEAGEPLSCCSEIGYVMQACDHQGA